MLSALAARLAGPALIVAAVAAAILGLRRSAERTAIARERLERQKDRNATLDRLHQAWLDGRPRGRDALARRLRDGRF